MRASATRFCGLGGSRSKTVGQGPELVLVAGCRRGDLLFANEAMAEARTNRPEGGAYNRIFGEKLRDEHLDFDKGDRSRLFERDGQPRRNRGMAGDADHL